MYICVCVCVYKTFYTRLLYLKKNAKYTKIYRNKLKKERVELENKQSESLNPNVTRYDISFT